MGNLVRIGGKFYKSAVENEELHKAILELGQILIDIREVFPDGGAWKTILCRIHIRNTPDGNKFGVEDFRIAPDYNPSKTHGYRIDSYEIESRVNYVYSRFEWIWGMVPYNVIALSLSKKNDIEWGLTVDVCGNYYQEDDGPDRFYQGHGHVRFSDIGTLQQSVVTPPEPVLPSEDAADFRVFISHATADRQLIGSMLLSHFNNSGIPSWYSSRGDIQTAEQWERSIVNGLRSCELFLLVMSPRSARSEWVKHELHWAFENRPGRIIPVMIETCDPVDFHIGLPRIQYEDLRNNSNAAIARLVERILRMRSEN